MTTQPSIESLRRSIAKVRTCTAYPLCTIEINEWLAALSELESLRASDAALREERDALLKHCTGSEGPYTMAVISEGDLAILRHNLTAANARAEEAERKFSRLQALSRKALDAVDQAEKRVADGFLTPAPISEGDLRALYSDLDAERSRADALAARVEVLERFACHKHDCAQIQQFGGLLARMERGLGPVDCDCGYKRLRDSTPAADLSAHDAKVRREAVETLWHAGGSAFCYVSDNADGSAKQAYIQRSRLESLLGLGSAVERKEDGDA